MSFSSPVAQRVALDGPNCAMYFRGGRREDVCRDRCAYLDWNGVYAHVEIYLILNKCVQIYVSSELNTSFKVFFLVSDLFVVDDEAFFSSLWLYSSGSVLFLC